MIKSIIKADGSEQPFDAKKINRWGQYAAKHGGDWTSVVLETVRRLPETAHSKDVHQTMIDVCVEKESIEYSRIAARLQLAAIRKHMDRHCMRDTEDFTDIATKFCEMGVWSDKVIPKPNKRWNQWYYELYEIRLEHWQIVQFVDKYGLKYKGETIETPHIAALGIGLAHHGDSEKAFDLAKAILKGQVNLPTPALNGGRNGDFDAVSCCVITGGDSIPSIGVAEHIAYSMTAKKAGIGIEFQTRSKGAKVKGGRTTHLGKHGIYATVDKSVKMFTQVTRGGSATVSYVCIDPEVMDMLMWKTQKIDRERRLDKLDYAFVYNDAFVEAVRKNEDWYLFCLQDAPLVHESFYTDTVDGYKAIVQHAIGLGIPHIKVNAQDMLKRYLTSRQETGRLYCTNVSRANKHTPFTDRISLSNLCQEIFLPTKAYEGMEDLYVGNEYNRSVGETAFCSLAAINVGKVSFDEYEKVARIALEVVDSMIEKTPCMTPTMRESMLRRRSVGIGITGLAQYLYGVGSDYDGSEESFEAVSQLAERHYFYLLKASQEMAKESGVCVQEGIDLQWLPVDTRINTKYQPKMDWESLRGKKRKHSVLVAHMPTESSAVFSGAVNGLYPPRDRIMYKQSRVGAVQFILDKDDFIPAWDVPNLTLTKYYSFVQDWADQGISSDYYTVPERFPDGKVPLSNLMREWIAQAVLGVKSMYYTNTKPNKAVQVHDLVATKEAEEEGCSTCKI